MTIKSAEREKHISHKIKGAILQPVKLQSVYRYFKTYVVKEYETYILAKQKLTLCMIPRKVIFTEVYRGLSTKNA